MSSVKCSLAGLVLIAAISGLCLGQHAGLVTVSDQYGIAWITPASHTYCVQNNVWNPDSGWVQTLTVNNVTGDFRVTASNAMKPTNGAPTSYASIFRGNHWGTATSNSGMPKLVSGIRYAWTTWRFKTPVNGTFNCVYDLWIDQRSNYTGGAPYGAELMIWLNYQGTIQPAGSKIATVSINGATWDVWGYMNPSSWNYIAFVRVNHVHSASFNINPFFKDAVSRGYMSSAWYLISVEAGFEIWQGGAGLMSSDYSVHIC